MSFRIRYHAEVVRRDIPVFDGPVREIIRAAIEERLVTNPIRYGKPLGRSLSGLRKVRVGDFRVIFRIVKDEVEVVGISHREGIKQGADKAPC